MAAVVSAGAFSQCYLREVPKDVQQPFIQADTYLVGGELRKWEGETVDILSPILDAEGKKIKIGSYPMTGKKEALEALDAANQAYNHGLGEWPSHSAQDRIRAVELFLEELKKKRTEVINLLMWEICKNKGDATKEFDRTIDYINDTIVEVKALWNRNSLFTTTGGVLAQIRRVPLGVCVCLGPFNYPFNETYTVLFPALLMGNTIVLKTPRTGCLCHMPTLDLFAKCFPAGVVNIIHGAGRTTLPPIMDTGKVDIFAFIGTSKAAVELQKIHPSPNRLRVCLGLDAKNPAIVCADADLTVAVSECVLGSLSFNGQRCTALKILLVHESVVDAFVPKFCEAVDKLKIGLPWEGGVAITPLPEPHKPQYIRDVVADAVSKGAKVVNTRGGLMDSSIVAPTVIYPVTPDMRAYEEEQFGPLVPIATWRDVEDIYKFFRDTSYGQQASLFSEDPNKVSGLLDFLVNQVSRVNINTQCQRGPDNLPFTGRKNSACGTLSVSDALRVMSIRTVIATKANHANQELLSDIMSARSSKYLRTDYMF
mmetsp:Transcript_25491/g.42740  ORF Transcript_25491/g.42740 Transcript_25491/m.42740 type:complete len:539 (+) Transcript_25491:254-1870(+)